MLLQEQVRQQAMQLELLQHKLNQAAALRSTASIDVRFDLQTIQTYVVVGHYCNIDVTVCYSLLYHMDHQHIGVRTMGRIRDGEGCPAYVSTV